ncbi:MAG TPA: hypothetical protein VK059_07575 [Nocardioidaceae bacterium]|nr:hypothetical protein [Nocardioidaceae bacterium]
MNTRGIGPGPVRFEVRRFVAVERCLDVLRAWSPDDRDLELFDDPVLELRDRGGEDVRVAIGAA